MRLGELIDTLERFPADWQVTRSDGRYPGSFGSWRGVYDELTLRPSDKPITVGQLLKAARAADGGTFHGWKGGEFTMTRETPVWADDAGDCDYDVILGAVPTDAGLVLSIANIEEYRF